MQLLTWLLPGWLAGAGWCGRSLSGLEKSCVRVRPRRRCVWRLHSQGQ